MLTRESSGLQDIYQCINTIFKVNTVLDTLLSEEFCFRWGTRSCPSFFLQGVAKQPTFTTRNWVWRFVFLILNCFVIVWFHYGFVLLGFLETNLFCQRSAGSLCTENAFQETFKGNCLCQRSLFIVCDVYNTRKMFSCLCQCVLWSVFLVLSVFSYKMRVLALNALIFPCQLVSILIV